MESKAYIHAYIINFTLPDNIAKLDDPTNIEGLIEECKSHKNEWSAPRDGHKGDILLFLFSKNAHDNLIKMQKQYQSKAEHINSSVSYIPVRPRRGKTRGYIYRKDTLNSLWRYQQSHYQLQRLNEISDLYNKYGATICAIGRMATDAYYSSAGDYHYYAKIEDLYLLENPLPERRFTGFLRISQGGTTSVYGSHFERIKNMILHDNPDFPDYLANSVAMSEEQYKLNSKNWLKKNLENRRHYKKEEEFRALYVDYLLKELSDDSNLYTECRCTRDGVRHQSFVDYVISFHSKWLPVEVKVNTDIEKDLKGQVRKYCNLSELKLDEDSYAVNDEIINNHVLIIDEEKVDIYDYDNNEIKELIRLDSIKTKKDITRLESLIVSELL